MFWFDKENPKAVFIDNREFDGELCDGRKLVVKPDRIMDFRKMDFCDASFSLVVFDPPHLFAGETGWQALKYGRLNKETWEEDLRRGFNECFRVLKKNGVLIFKWSDTTFPVARILTLTKESPLFGHRVGRLNKTHWITFIKV